MADYTPYQARYFAEQITLKRPQSSYDSLASAMSGVKVDLNPHQVDAALFAVKSPLSTGALLADEVGLGKTIEAGLVLAQYWAERKRHILLIVPAALRTQWRAELKEKFYIDSLIMESTSYNKLKKEGNFNPFDTKNQVVICSYNFAARRADELRRIPWDLVVIDEAHRLRNVYKPDNVTGKKLKESLQGRKKLLLTATPLQNNLMELYGLVSLIDDHVFGDAKTFREMYVAVNNSELRNRNLRARLGGFCKRTLRKQVTEYVRYTERHPILQEYTPTEAEEKLYTLAHALNDGQYVKVPAVITRKDFRAEEYTPEQLDKEKLNDGVRIHEDTKSQLEIYARTYGKPLVKPFVLVVAKDTEHSRQIREYLTSDEFFRGYYKDKVLEINSAQRGAEKDENITQLLSLEKPENKIEIVVHVNMLKEGWDVTNLYTIIPLRASASETLTEQTIGRGLRLPYGLRTGIEEVDRLSIVSHDKYAAIVNLANDPNSLVRKVYYIDDVSPDTEEAREAVELTPTYDSITSDASFTEQLAMSFMQETPASYSSGETKTQEQALEVAKFVAHFTAKSVLELNKQVKTYDAAKDEAAKQFVQQTVVSATLRQFPALQLRPEDVVPVVQTAIKTCVQALTDKVIPIPQAVVQPFTEVKQGYYTFTLDTRNMNWHPGNDILIGTELQADGKTFEYDPDFHASEAVDTPENEIVRHLIIYDDIDYMTTADLLYSLVRDAKNHFLTYLSEEETERVMRDRQKTIAEIIYSQMKQHFFREETAFRASEMRPFSRIEASFGGKIKSDEIYDLRASISVGEVRSKVFNGFKKACHTLYKFDNNTERTFAIVLENDKEVLKWMRPSPKQFNIYYGPGGCSRYEPDFIVETASAIYMVETKMSKELSDPEVLEKAKAAQVYCSAASAWNAEHCGKPWMYALVSHDEVRLNSSFHYLMENRVPAEQMSF